MNAVLACWRSCKRRRSDSVREVPWRPTTLMQQMLDDAQREVAKLEEQGTTWENPNKFRHDRTEKGTPFVGDVAGY